MSKTVAKSEMDKAYDARSCEDDIYRLWERTGYFGPQASSKGKPFTIAMPPPNATGILHIGHALGLAYQDIMIRYHRLRGDAALWIPGTDHAAIATQNKVEKILHSEGTSKEALGREKFLDRVRTYVSDSQTTIKTQIRKVGCSCDWSREAYTFDELRAQAVTEAFVRMYRDGLIYRGNRIVNWCPRCASTLSDDEVEYREQAAKMYYIQYGPLVIATTRPETKLADTGVAVHPEDKRYSSYIGKNIKINLAGHNIEVKVFADPAVDPNFGTGAIGVTPAHSGIDFAWAQKYGLPVIKLIDEQGKILASGGKYAGLTITEARQKFIDDLQAAGQLLKIEDIQNNLSVCYRCETPVEPMTSDQWFVAVDNIIPGRKQSLKQLAQVAVRSGKINILPGRFEKIYFHWIDNLHDWCISRQLWWGHRIPVWYDDQGRVIVAHDEAEAQAQAGERKLRQDEDTLNTWFSSSLWTFSILGWPAKTKDIKKYHPTQVMETGYDIIFFWVARMIMMSEYLLGQEPFDTVYLHGLVRDREGRKMSKSLGNGLEPIEVIEKYGADAVRLALVAGSAAGADMRIYEEKIAAYRNFVNKLWNISRFIFGFVPEIKLVSKSPKAMTMADKWIAGELDLLINNVTEDLEKLRFSSAIEKLYDFTWNKFADWYLEICKLEKARNADIYQSQSEILLFILARILTLWHPFVPFVSEKIWQNFPAAKMLLVQNWPASGKAKPDNDFGQWQELAIAIRNIKAENKVPVRQKVKAKVESTHFNRSDLELLALMTQLELVETIDDSQTMVIADTKICLELKKPDQSKDKQKLASQIAKWEQLLADEKFIKQAPDQIVVETRAKLAEAKKRLSEF